MTLDQAINRLKFTHLEHNTPTDQDRLALNQILIELNHRQAQANESNNNTLLKKCITKLFTNDLRRTKGNYEIALMNLNTVLKCSLQDRVNELQAETISHLSPITPAQLEHASTKQVTSRLAALTKTLIQKYSGNL